ncbi:uncharacterized protein DS421_17g578910 [Arachis hypogaea]|nr:uncharacterized protein DS421_17g578910 [Arachis hypogaea]
MFDVREKESKILKAKIMIDGEKIMRDSLKLKSHDQKLMKIGLRYERIGIFFTYCALLGHRPKVCGALLEDTVTNKIKKDMVGKWLKADQMGRRIIVKEKLNPTRNINQAKADPQPQKKPPPSWLLDGFANLSVVETGATRENQMVWIVMR